MTNYKEKNIIFTIDILFYCIILFLKFYEKIFIADALSERVVGLLDLFPIHTDLVNITVAHAVRRSGQADYAQVRVAFAHTGDNGFCCWVDAMTFINDNSGKIGLKAVNAVKYGPWRSENSRVAGGFNANGRTKQAGGISGGDVLCIVLLDELFAWSHAQQLFS